MNNTYYIYFNGDLLGEVSGCEAAWDAFSVACELADTLNARVDLVDGQTGEVIADNGDE